MRTLSRIVISLPLLGVAWIIGATAMNAASQNVNATKAVELLAKSEAVDSKCNYLSASEHDELGDYLAKAEIIAAGREGPGPASGAVKSGRTAGASMDCGRESEITVRATMDAARRAMSAAERQAERQVTAKSEPAKKRTKALRSAAADDPLPRENSSLNNYSRFAAAYYVERRCKHLSHAQAVDFWKRIVRMHNSVLSMQGPGALSRAKSRAIAAAKSARRCNQTTARLVRSTYLRMRDH